MKQFLLLTSLLFGLTRAGASSSIDSIEICDLRSDSNKTVFNTLASNPQDLNGSVTINQPLQGAYQAFNLNSADALAKGNFWKKVGNFFQGVYDVLAFKKTFGYFEVGGQTPEGPFTLFDRTTGAPSLQAQVASIQDWILGDDEAKKIYIGIWDQATNGSTNTDCRGSGVCKAAETAKCAAFIYIIGLKVVGTDPTSRTISRMGTAPSYIGQSERDTFYEIAMDVLENLEVPYRGGEISDVGAVAFSLNVLTLGIVNRLITITENAIEWEDMQYRAKEQMMLLEAFDLLKNSKKINPDLEEPSSTRIDDVTESLRKNIVIPMHRRVKWGQYYANNNTTLMPAAAMAMASVVLHDNGDWVLKINGHPKEWANAANYHINNTMWDAVIGSPMSKRGGEYGYAEGTHYFQYSFESLLPYFKTYSNFVPTNYNRDYRAGLLGLSTSEVKSYSDDEAYHHLYRWYNKILQPDGTHPSIDDGFISGGFNGVLALTKIHGSEKKGYNWNTLGLDGVNGLNLRPDYLCALSKPSEVGPENKAYAFASSVQLSSGSTIFRSNQITPATIHYAHMLAEPEEAIARKPFGVLVTHDHADVGAITIGAMDLGDETFELLTFDPPMRHVDDRDDVKKGEHHSIVQVDHSAGFGIHDMGPDYNTEATIMDALNESPYGDFAETTIKWEFYNTTYERHFKVFRAPGPGGYYYVVNDNVKVKDPSIIPDVSETFTLRINGNGEDGEGTFITTAGGTRAKWSHPCDKGRKWGLIAETVTSNAAFTALGTNSSNQHGNKAGDYITDTRTAGDKKYGIHSQLTSEVSGELYPNFGFGTVLKPYKCADAALGLPYTVIRMVPAYGSQLLTNISDDRFNRFHFSRNDKDNPLPDTIMNPFENDVYAVMETDAKDGFFTLSDDPMLTDGGCVTYTIFRSAYTSKSTLFKYRDTTYIESDYQADSYYKIDGKYHYSGYCKTYDSATTVNFFLPDMNPSFMMQAIGGLSQTYDTNTFIMSVTFPAHKTTKFVFEITDPCKLSCFYPDSASNIVSTFTHSDRMRRYLGHPLKILQDSGRLNIYNGSQMNICSNNYLCNRDSLFLLKEKFTDGTDLSRCDMDRLAGGLAQGSDQRSAIIVNENAALILDSGSYTYIGANSSLYIKKEGSLIIKAGAVVEIGSLIPEGHGEIIAFDGSYLCIEEGADIHFFKNVNDTSDKNIFYAILQQQSLPSGDKVDATQIGVNRVIERKLITDNMIDYVPSCTHLCDLETIMPPWGLYNREWGYAPFAFPKATYRIHNDTVCPGDSVEINLKHILNESGYEISVCRVDSPSSSPIYLECLLTSDSGTFVDQRNQLALDDLDCIEIRRAPESFKFILKDTGWYKIYVSAYNDCGVKHDTTGFIYVPPTPNVNFSIPDSACPGYGTVVADGSATISYVNSAKYSWVVSLITPDSVISMNGEPINYGASWDFEGASVQNDFDFPGFKWVGGFKYTVGLTVKGWCESVTKWDTINFPLMVIAGVHNAASYDNPVGPHAVQLEGLVSGATSWSWSPTDYLDYPDSLNPIATPAESIVYVLTGTSGGCSISDTITINHNTLAYAGEDRSVCFDEKAVLGTAYNAAVLWGFLNYKSAGGLTTAFSIFKNDYSYWNDLPIQKYFTQFLVDQGLSGSVSSHYLFTQLWNAHPEIRDAIINDSRFSTYFDLFMTDYTDALDYFEFELIANNTNLKDSIDNLYVSSYWNTYTGIYGIFQEYYTWLANHRYFSPTLDPLDTIDIIWEKKVGTLWVELTDWRGHYNLLADTGKTTTYRMTLIDDDYYAPVVEYDEVVISVDTPLVVSFAPAYQLDSSIYFVNSTYNDNSTTSYKWYFGDGDSSDDVSPYHRFRAFDSVYYVCLVATNSCGTDSYCDSVVVDSSGLIFGGFNKKENESDSLGQNIVNSTKRLIQNTYNKNENYLSVNVPNPFSELTTIEYATKDQNKNAEIRITNILGQHIKTYSLPGSKGVLVVEGSLLKDGLYFYSLVIDDTIFESKRMLVRH